MIVDPRLMPEMLEAGRAALTEARQKDYSDLQTLVEVYLAMEGMKLILCARERYGVAH